MSNKANTNPALNDADKARLLADITNKFDAKSLPREVLITVGFTVRNCTQLIGNTLNDPDVLGWFFHLPNQVNAFVGQITMSRLAIRTVQGTRRLVKEPMSSPPNTPLIRPKVFIQRPEPDFSDGRPLSEHREDDYAAAIVTTDSKFFNSTAAIMSDLTHHTEWGRACFVRRSDLKYMQLLIMAQPEPYNDLFFSGSLVTYDIMHNPRLRVMQFTLPHAEGFVSDSGTAFTFKGEPIVNDIEEDNVSTGDDLLEDLSTASDVSIFPDGVGDDPAPDDEEQVPMFPGAIMASPCPDFWDIINEIGNHLNINSPAEAEALLQVYDEVEDTIIGNGGGNQPALEQLLLEKNQGLLYRILSAIINFFTFLRDG